MVAKTLTLTDEAAETLALTDIGAESPALSENSAETTAPTDVAPESSVPSDMAEEIPADSESATAGTTENERETVGTEVMAITEEVRPPTGLKSDPRPLRRRTAVVAMQRLRDDFLSAAQNQVEREASMMALTLAVDAMLTAALEALERADEINQAQVSAALGNLRSRVADQMSNREREQAALHTELEETKQQLVETLREASPTLDLSSLDAPVIPEAKSKRKNGRSRSRGKAATANVHGGVANGAGKRHSAQGHGTARQYDS